MLKFKNFANRVNIKWNNNNIQDLLNRRIRWKNFTSIHMYHQFPTVNWVHFRKLEKLQFEGQQKNNYLSQKRKPTNLYST